MSVAEAQERISSREFAEWAEYYQQDPFDRAREDWRAALIAKILATVHRGKGSRIPKIEDFMPRFKARRPSVQTAEEIYGTLLAVAQAYGPGRARRRPRRSKD